MLYSWIDSVLFFYIAWYLAYYLTCLKYIDNKLEIVYHCLYFEISAGQQVMKRMMQSSFQNNSVTNQ